MSTVYVSPTGNDANTYAQAQSSATPWQTIGKCETSATDGDTIILMAGTHTWASVTFTKAFTIQGATADESLYALNGGAGEPRWTNSKTSGVISISYVTFLNASQNIFFYINSTGAAFTFTNCIINVNYKASATVSICSTNKQSSFTMANVLVKGLGVSGTSRYLFYNSDAFSMNITLTGCTFYIPAITGLIGIPYGASTTVIKNCIIYATGSTPYGTGISSTATYSDFYNITSHPTGTGVITSDPLFVDAPNGNFNLRQASPCVGTGSV